MTVVRNEFERGENNPASSILSERISAAAYEWHNYGKSTIGNRSDIERVPIENLQAFYKKYYQPDNVVLIVAGKIRRGEGPRPRGEVSRLDPQAGPPVGRDLHRGTSPGRRADRHAAAGGRGRLRWGSPIMFRRLRTTTGRR